MAEAKISLDITSTVIIFFIPSRTCITLTLVYQSTTNLSAKFMAEARIIRHTSFLHGWIVWRRDCKIIWSATFSGAQP